MLVFLTIRVFFIDKIDLIFHKISANNEPEHLSTWLDHLQPTSKSFFTAFNILLVQ